MSPPGPARTNSFIEHALKECKKNEGFEKPVCLSYGSYNPHASFRHGPICYNTYVVKLIRVMKNALFICLHAKEQQK